MSAAAGLYSVRGVVKHYAGRPRPAVDVAELDVLEGECLCLVGPSGAGKSTLLRLLHFLSATDRGEIRFDGTPVSFPAPLALRREIAMVFQRPELLDGSVRRNVEYGLALRGRRDAAQVLQAIESVGLGDLADEPARQLSGGEAQRVALARVLALGTRAVLLDEPTANLDRGNVALIEGRLQRLRAETSATVVLVTHNLHQARRLADRIAFMLDGRLIEIAAAERFFDAPQDPRTAEFVRGDMVY